MHYEIAIAIVTALCSYIVWLLKKLTNTRGYTATGVMILLRREINNIYDELKDKEQITKDEYREMYEAYDVYHSLGGNGIGTKMFNEISEKEIV